MIFVLMTSIFVKLHYTLVISGCQEAFKIFIQLKKVQITQQETCSRTLFTNIYRELNKESKNFSPSLIEAKAKTRDFAASIAWLTMAHIVNQSFQLKEHISLPLMPDSESNFRLFLGDIGMFSYQSGVNAASFVSTEREHERPLIELTAITYARAKYPCIQTTPLKRRPTFGSPSRSFSLMQTST